MPGLNLRPSISLICGRSSQAFAPTPRSCALASVPSALVTMFTTCDSSGDTSGRPSLPLAVPGRLVISGTWSRVITELVSACDPPRRMIAVSALPVPFNVAWKPSPIASIATSTPTTPAMPITITDAAPQRCGRLPMPMPATVRVCCPCRVSSSHASSPAASASTPYHGR